MPLLETLALAGGGQAIGRLRERIRPNPYAPVLPDQAAAAIFQAGDLRPGTAGLTGSEAEWFEDQQGASTVGYLRIVQDVPSRALPPSMFIPGDPGADPDDPLVLADFRDAPTRVGNPDWGNNVYPGIPHVITARINEPTARTPLPREVAAGRAATADKTDADPWDQLYEG